MVLGEVSDKTRIPKGLLLSCWGGGGGGITEVGSELLLWIAARHAHCAFPLNRYSLVKRGCGL
jgi:hypothetical protein